MQDELTPNSKVDGKRIGEDAGSLACDALSVLRVAEEKPLLNIAVAALPRINALLGRRL